MYTLIYLYIGCRKDFRQAHMELLDRLCERPGQLTLSQYVHRMMKEVRKNLHKNHQIIYSSFTT